MSLSPPEPIRPAPGPSPSEAAWKVHAVTAVVHGTLESLLTAVPYVEDPFAAELLGSDACAIWWASAAESDVPAREREARVGRAYAAHLGELGSPEALAALRALQLGGSDDLVREVASTAEGLSAAGVAEPLWWGRARDLRALRAARVSWSSDGRRYTSHLLEVDRAGEVVTLAVATLDDAAGVIGDVLVFTDLDGFADVVREGSAGRAAVGRISVATAVGRIRQAVDRTDLLGVGDPPGHALPEVGYTAFRGLAQRWTAAIRG